MAMGNNPIMMIDPVGGWYISTGFDVFTAVSNAAAALGILGFHTLQNMHNPSYKPDWGGGENTYSLTIIVTNDINIPSNNTLRNALIPAIDESNKILKKYDVPIKVNMVNYKDITELEDNHRYIIVGRMVENMSPRKTVTLGDAIDKLANGDEKVEFYKPDVQKGLSDNMGGDLVLNIL